MSKTKTSLLVPEELNTLSSLLLKKEDNSIYDVLDQIFSIIDRYPEVEEYIMSSKSKETVVDIEELENSNKDALSSLSEFLKELEMAFPKTGVMQDHWENIDAVCSLPAEEDAMYSYYILKEINHFLEDVLENNFLIGKETLFESYLEVSETDTYSFKWIDRDIFSYLDWFFRIERNEKTKAWYHYINLKHLASLWGNRFYKPGYPVSFYDSLVTTADLLKLEEYPTLRIKKFQISEVKASWSLVYSYIKERSNINDEDIVIMFDRDSGKYELPDGKSGSLSKNKPDYKILLHFVSGEKFVDIGEFLSLNDSTLRSELTGDLRKKLKLNKNQLVNKDGFLSLLGVHIVSM